ncbi:MAG: sulfurtransferase, partial [Propionibacteriaceae bacterium]|nr:sulfurtransferase [Propionibacteriaceae bacterium]
MTHSTIIPAAQSILDLKQGADPVILDASLHLAEARFDGDYRATSGRLAWLRARIPGARHVDLLREWIEPGAAYHFAAPSPHQLGQDLGRAGIDGTREIWIYDRTNLIWATRLWWTLRNAGIAAAVIDGGLAGWQAAGGVIESGEPASVPQRVDPPQITDLGLWADRSEVEAALAEPDPSGPVLVCALSAKATWGRVPTRYTRRGHIPGSVNIAAHSLLGGDGTLAGGPDPLRLAGLDLVADREVIVYCGGGISASLTAMALVRRGLTNVRIYDGSLEEWSA